MSDMRVASAVKQAIAGLEAVRGFTASLAQLRDSGVERRLDRIGAIVATLDQPVVADPDASPEEGAMALLRAFDRHGEGLRPFVADQPHEPGDVIIDSARAVWLVDAVDKDDRITSLLGASAKPKSLPVLQWRPTTTARAWIGEGQQAGAAYREPPRALAALAGLWGLSESETRYFKRPEALFWQLVETPGVKLTRKGLEDEAELPALRRWLAGQGMRPLAETAGPGPGDLVDSPLCQGLGIVLRAQYELCDLLYIERKARGPLGEAKGTAQIMRAVALPPQTAIWHPA